MPHKHSLSGDAEVGSWRLLRRSLRRGAETLLDVTFPTRCLVCGAEAQAAFERLLCSACAQGWRTLPEGCQRCGQPDTNQTLPFTCQKCLQTPPLFSRARALGAYDGKMPALMRTLKEERGRKLATYFGKRLAEALPSLLPGPAPELVVPVPLHWERLLMRGFNQAVRLAEPVAESLQIPLLPALTRAAPIHKQAWLGLRERQQNQQQAIQVDPRHAARLQDRRILLIDDVFTTGATGNLCAQELSAAGAAQVDVLTLARAL